MIDRRPPAETQAPGRGHDPVEQTLRARNEELLVVFDQAPLAMMLVDGERRVRMANRAAAKLADRPVAEMVGLRGGEALRCLHHLDDPRGCGFGAACESCIPRRTVLETLETGANQSRVEASLTLMRGEREEQRELLISTVSIDVAGEPMVLVSIEDVTEQKRSREKIARQNVFLESVLEALTHPFYVINAQDYTIEMANSAAVKSGEPEERTACCYELTHRRDAPCADAGIPCPLEEVKRTGEPVTVEHVHYDEAGNPRHVEVHGYPIFGPAGNVVQVIEYTLDVTERRHSEEALRRRTEELEARNEELDAFAHTVAHDLQNPLGLVVGYAELLAQDPAEVSTEKLRQSLRAIARNARRMERIIDELLLLAGLRQVEVQTSPLDMATIVAEACERVAGAIESSGAEIVLPEAWPTALGHAPWIEEVWANYLSNAVKYGGRPPHVELGAETEPEGNVRFWIRDNGPGLTVEEQERLFTPFTRLGQVRATGHGLGLSIVRRIVERLGGQVGVESEVGQGSVFSFTLPGADRE